MGCKQGCKWKLNVNLYGKRHKGLEEDVIEAVPGRVDRRLSHPVQMSIMFRILIASGRKAVGYHNEGLGDNWELGKAQLPGS